MPLIAGCCCFESLVRGSRASAVFTMVVSVVNFVIDVATLVRLHYLVDNAEPQQSLLYMPLGIIPIMYIELFLSVGTFCLGILLLIGINYQHDGRKFIIAWVAGMVFDRVWDIFIGIYVMAWAGGHRFREMIFIIPESIVVAIYWVLNFFLFIAALVCVLSYWQELQNDLYGKERRIKYFRKMANIRSAALSGHSTPYRSHFGSKSSLMMSHGSVNPGFVQKY